MKYTKANIQEGIATKIKSLSIPDELKEFYIDSLQNYPNEIEQNVLEWVNNIPLTDVDCHGESIVKIMNLWGFTEADIHKIILGFQDFRDGDWQMPNYIWQAVTGLSGIYD